MTWYCKANFKTNSSRLEIKVGKSCPHSFKYINYKRDYTANNNKYQFWKNQFNCK